MRGENMPSPTSTYALGPVRLTRAGRRIRHILPDSCTECLTAAVPRETSGVGPLRVRRRLTRAQRRSERRSARRNAWLRSQEEDRPRIEAASRADVPPAAPSPPQPHRCNEASDARVLPDENGGSSSGDSNSSSSSESSNNGSSAITTTTTTPNGNVDQGNNPGGQPCRLGVPLVLRDLNQAANLAIVAPTGAPMAIQDAAVTPASGLTPKEALQQRLLLLRRRDGLIDITIRTMKLMRRNQLLQHRLIALQAETRAFVRSVLNNPENRGIRQAAAAAAAAVVPRPDSGVSP